MPQRQAERNQALTAREALRLGTERLKQAGVDSPQLDMSLLLAEALGVDRLGLYLDLERPLSGGEREAARAMLARRLRREPVAYILGRREFHGLLFEVGPGVLVPRPETEHLVELALGWLREHGGAGMRVADIGTGSGAIAVAVAKACAEVEIVATDVSPDALEVARRNALQHDVTGRIEFVRGDLFAPLQGRFDAILSNLPYVAEGERAALTTDVRDYEPAGALFAGEDGLDAIRRLIAGAPEYLKPGGLLAMECGQGQAERIMELIKQTATFEAPETLADYAGTPRVVHARRK